jgi:hypothetical protein
MIARIVHGHLPEEQIKHKCFSKYELKDIEVEAEEGVNNFTMNIDKLLQNFTQDSIKH